MGPEALLPVTAVASCQPKALGKVPNSARCHLGVASPIPSGPVAARTHTPPCGAVCSATQDPQDGSGCKGQEVHKGNQTPPLRE